MRSSVLLIAWCVLAPLAMCWPVNGRGQPPSVLDTCAARAGTGSPVPVTWHVSSHEDLGELERWCRAVGRPVIVLSPPGGVDELPGPDDLVVLTWNAHMFEGDLGALIADLRAGRLTGGQPVKHFVLLLQELYRRGSDVPPFPADGRSAFAITGRDGRGGDAHDHATTLGLSMLYVPSMRNGANAFEDRGNAIVSTERLHAPFAVELPLERQRRVAVGAAIDVRTIDGPDRLDVVTAHLEPMSSRASLWIFSSPRPRQVVALLNVLRTSRPSQAVRSSGTVLGGDFNTIQAGAGEDAYSIARAWSRSLMSEDPRRTHVMGRLDYLFFRLQDGWTASTTRVGAKYGSDHHPVVGRLAPRQVSP